MAPTPKRLPSFVFWIEIMVWLVLTYLGRSYFNQITAQLKPDILVLALKFLLFLGIIWLAVQVHNRLERYLRERGMID
jgi:hypothetical protein